MREQLKNYKAAVQCFCGEKIVIESDSLFNLLPNIQLNMITHIKENHPEEMDKFRNELKKNIWQMFNKMFNEFGDFF